MKQIRIRIAALGLAAACWGIMFPDYTYTPDSYAVIREGETDAAGGMEDVQDSEKGASQSERSRQDGSGAYSAQEIMQAAKEGKVSYRLKIYEFLKKNFWGTAGSRYRGIPEDTV